MRIRNLRERKNIQKFLIQNQITHNYQIIHICSEQVR